MNTCAVKDKIGDMPLVLHGGTGIPADMIQKAISLEFLRLMLIQNASFHLLMQQESILKQAKILKERDLILESFWLLDVKLLKKLYVRRLIFWFSWKSLIKTDWRYLFYG